MDRCRHARKAERQFRKIIGYREFAKLALAVELVPIRGSASTELVEEVAVIVAEIVLQRLEAQRAPEWMRVDDAAQYLRTTPAAIRALIKRDKIPHHHVNGRVLFERQELDGWVRDDGT